jgi:Uncharacterised protein family (UPF0236)
MTTSTSVPRRARRPHVKIRRARRDQVQEQQRLADEILSAGAATATAAQAAATITQAQLTDAEIQAWRQDLEARLATIQQHSEQNLGFIEEQIALATQEPMRLLAERAAQAKANATPCQCWKCQGQLRHQKFLARTIDSRFGPLRVFRHYGWCAQCEQWQFPADHALGLSRHAPASPYVQEMAALLVSKMPPEQAVLVAERLGLTLSRCTLDREAHRQGLRAEAARAADLSRLDTWEGLQGLAAATAGPPSQPFTLVIEIDAWNIRERDHWGQTEELRAQGESVARWHWVYVGTVFRLDHRAQTASGRALISQRAYAVTRAGVDALIRQLYYEALVCGLGQAKDVLVIADGAVWIWNAVADRFPEARQRLDLYHGDEHLWAVAHELYGHDTPEARAWVDPLLQQLRHDDGPGVIRSLKELQPRLTQSLQEKVQKQIDYFQNNAQRMAYREILRARKAVKQGKATPAQVRKANEPLGSGAVESTCRQYQCRFKRTGQFWSTAGDEALMCLETFWRNDRWHELFPHAKLTSPHLN